MSVTKNFENHLNLTIALFSGQGSEADSCGVFTAGLPAQAQGQG